MDAIAIDNLCVSFDEEAVLENVSFKLPEGKKLVVTGASGSGKTTLLNVLAGFVLPQKGTVRIFGDVLSEENIQAIRSKMAWVPQALDFPVNTVRELLMLPFTYKRNKPLTPSESEVAGVFDRLGLKPNLLDKSVKEISGGQKQRVVIASCYFLKKPLMILDEPTSALDSVAKKKMMDLLFEDPALTMVSVSHDREWINASDQEINLNGIT